MTLKLKSKEFPILTLPNELLEEILKFLSFHEIANLRRVCSKFNETCKRLLNQGFQDAKNFHEKYSKVLNHKI